VGIAAKLKTGRYTPRETSWVKMKTPAVSFESPVSKTPQLGAHVFASALIRRGVSDERPGEKTKGIRFRRPSIRRRSVSCPELDARTRIGDVYTSRNSLHDFPALISPGNAVFLALPVRAMRKSEIFACS
jgi:hypothetical protein